MEERKKLNIACMGHNSYWYYAEKFAKQQGHTLDNFGNSMFHFYHDADLDNNVYDMLILFSTEPYSAHQEEMMNSALEALREKSGGAMASAYLYCIPEDKRTDDNTDGVILKKSTEDGTVTKRYLVNCNYGVIDLIYEAIDFYKNGVTIETPVMKILIDKE